MSQATQEIQQLKEQLSTETRLKAEAQEKTRDLETSLAEVKEENMSLKKDIEDHEEDWKTRLEAAEKKMAEVERVHNSFKQLLADIVAAIWGPRNAINIETPDNKLRALLTLVRQQYYGAGRAIAAARGLESPPTQLKQFLGHLSTIPEWVTRWKLSGCRKGAMRVMSLAKAHYPDLHPAKLAGGFPQFKLDNTEFGGKDLAVVSKETRYAASVIVEGLFLDKFQHGYDKKSRRIDTPDPVPTILIPPQMLRGQT